MKATDPKLLLGIYTQQPSGRGNFPREFLIETIAETGVRQNTVERSSEIIMLK